MAEAKQIADWDRTAALRMELRNLLGGRRTATSFLEMHPLRSRAKPKQLSNSASRRTVDNFFKAWQSTPSAN